MYICIYDIVQYVHVDKQKKTNQPPNYIHGYFNSTIGKGKCYKVTDGPPVGLHVEITNKQNPKHLKALLYAKLGLGLYYLQLHVHFLYIQHVLRVVSQVLQMRKTSK